MTQLSMWVIYENPKDFPDKFVARMFINDKPTGNIYVGDTLEDVRKIIPQGLALLPRFPQDDPKMVEVWL